MKKPSKNSRNSKPGAKRPARKSRNSRPKSPSSKRKSSRSKSSSKPSPNSFTPPAHNYLRAWHEAADKERAARDSVFFDEPCELAGIPVRLMTLADMRTLVAIKSPFVCGGPVHAVDIPLFLWVLFTGHSAGTAAREEFYAHVCTLDYSALLAEIDEYLELVFLDSPDGSGSPGAVSVYATVIDAVASEYHWRAEEVMAMPLPRLFQFQRAIARRKGHGTGSNRITAAAQARYCEERDKVPVEHRDAWHAHQWAEICKAKEAA